jgi:putative FmdB family regulatory protein
VPTYEYECSKCNDRFEKFQSMKDEPMKSCPKCGGAVHRLISSGGGIIFKGTGFYETDYKNKSKPPKGDSCPGSKEGGCKGCPKNKDNA